MAMAGRSAASQSGQAAVESALVLPLMVFILLGIIQISIAWQARLLSEYAAFKVARSASVYRLDCGHMVKAGLMALVPSISRTGKGTPQQRFLSAAKQVLSANRPPGLPAFSNAVPLVRVDYRVSGARERFDTPLDGTARPMKVHVRLAYFYEYRIPFAGWILSRIWLASQTGRAWTRGADLVMPVKARADPAPRVSRPSPDWQVVERAMAQDYFTVPIVATWSLRMMSDPLPNLPMEGQCQ